MPKLWKLCMSDNGSRIPEGRTRQISATERDKGMTPGPLAAAFLEAVRRTGEGGGGEAEGGTDGDRRRGRG